MAAFFFLICLVFFSNELGNVKGWDTLLTTPGFKETFLNRCKDFGELERTPEIYEKKAFDKTNCDKLWQIFKGAVGHKNPCHIDIDSYKEFIAESNGRLIQSKFKSGEIFKDKTTFWSDTKPYADAMSRIPNSKFLTLGSLFQGYVVDVLGLSWCGDPEDPKDQNDGFKFAENNRDMRNCTGKLKTGTIKNCNPVEHYWNAMSVDLGVLSKGKAYVLLNAHCTQRLDNGKLRAAYSRGSVFANYELPELKKNKDVTALEVIAIIPFSKDNARAYCDGQKGDDSSLKDLKEDAEKGDSVFDEKLKTYTCTDFPESEEFKKVLCTKTGNKFNTDGCSKLTSKP